MSDNLDCATIFLFKNGKVLVGKRHYTPDKWKDIVVWTTPGGRCDPGEELVDTLRREVAEETGITNFEIIKFLGQTPGGREIDRVHAFLGTTDQEPQLLEPDKFSEWKWIDTDHMPEDFVNPKQWELLKSNRV